MTDKLQRLVEDYAIESDHVDGDEPERVVANIVERLNAAAVSLRAALNARGSTFKPSLKVRVIASAAMDNAPSGYLAARVEILPGILFVDSERNPFTNGEWRWLMFHLGDADHPRSTPLISVQLSSVNRRGLIGEVCTLFDCVSALFEGDFSADWRDHLRKRAANDDAELDEIIGDLSALAKPIPGHGTPSEIHQLAGTIIRLLGVTQRLVRDMNELKERWRR